MAPRRLDQSTCKRCGHEKRRVGKHQQWRCATCDQARAQHRLAEAGPCEVEGCDRPAQLRGFCELHHQRIQRTGNPGPVGYLRLPRDVAEKKCKDCGVEKPAECYYRNKAGYLYPRCKPCHNVRTKHWVENNREKRNAASRRRYRSGENKRKRAEKRLQKYGLSQGDYDALLFTQGNVCAVCLEPFADSRGSRPGDPLVASIDHCHETGQVRGILHRRCNLAIEYLMSDECIERARRYLAQTPPD